MRRGVRDACGGTGVRRSPRLFNNNELTPTLCPRYIGLYITRVLGAFSPGDLREELGSFLSRRIPVFYHSILEERRD